MRCWQAGRHLGGAATPFQPLAPQGPALSLGGPSPDSGALVGFQGVLQTDVDNGADTADGFGAFDLTYRGLRSREEESMGIGGTRRLLFPLGRQVAPDSRCSSAHRTSLPTYRSQSKTGPSRLVASFTRSRRPTPLPTRSAGGDSPARCRICSRSPRAGTGFPIVGAVKPDEVE